jgi:hypothetical protein
MTVLFDTATKREFVTRVVRGVPYGHAARAMNIPRDDHGNLVTWAWMRTEEYSAMFREEIMRQYPDGPAPCNNPADHGLATDPSRRCRWIVGRARCKFPPLKNDDLCWLHQDKLRRDDDSRELELLGPALEPEVVEVLHGAD